MKSAGASGTGDSGTYRTRRSRRVTKREDEEGSCTREGVDKDHMSNHNKSESTSAERSTNTIGSMPSVKMATSTEGYLQTSDTTDLDAATKVSSRIDQDKRVEYSDDDDDAHISAPSSAVEFQPLQPLSETEPSVEQTRSLRSRTRSSAARTTQSVPSVAAGQDSSCSSSAAASPENGFMNNMVDPVAATTRFPPVASAAASKASSLSRTPPSNASTSYESSHFGKRHRSGSLSDRLLASSELEEKGVINRDQKGILKDLIISGQDNELQRALDLYEQGDSSVLEGMLQTGTLSNKAAEEIDLLGDLNFDFLNVKEQAAVVAARSRGNSLASQPQGAGSVASDGIGELDFDGGIGNWEQGTTSRSRSNSTWSQLEHVLQQQQQRSRANSNVSIDLDNFRQRSNSLFSSLLGNEPQDPLANYGRWMDPGSVPAAAAGNGSSNAELTQEEILLQQQQHHEQHFQQLLLRQQQQRQQEEAASQMEDEELPPRRKPGRRVSVPNSAKPSKEELKEQKKKERLLKKELKEREKQEKKEKKEQAKLEKQKKKEETQSQEKEKEREEHVSGSGRPRSLSDPNLNVSLDDDGLMQVERPDGWIGAYSPESRKVRISRFLEKRNHRVWTKTVKYDVRKNFADSRLRVKGRFVKKEDELLMRELMSLT